MNHQSEIYKITFNQLNNNYKLILKNTHSNDYCELEVKSSDAKNIALAREGVISQRLKTYNFIISIFNLLNIKIDKIIILKKNNFITSNIILIIEGSKISIESNFIDAIILSLKTFSVLLINDNLYKSESNLIYEDFKYINIKDNLLNAVDGKNKIKKLKNALNKLVQDEKYESAAIIRDEILKISKK